MTNILLYQFVYDWRFYGKDANFGMIKEWIIYEYGYNGNNGYNEKVYFIN